MEQPFCCWFGYLQKDSPSWVTLLRVRREGNPLLQLCSVAIAYFVSE